MAAAGSYLTELTSRLRALLGEELVGVYAGGSYALGEYVPGRSDLDVAVVVRGLLPPSLADALVATVRHEALPCPARGLELVVYPLSVTSAPTAEAGFLLNLNTGAGMELRADVDEAAAERHWFPIDRSILAQHGVALAGPPAAAVFTGLPRRELLPLLVESLVWHGAAETPARFEDTVLNAARALRFVREGAWSGKHDAGRWALATLGDDEAVAQALAARSGDGGRVDPAEAARFRQLVCDAVRALVHTSTGAD